MKSIPNFPDYAITRDGRVWSKPRKLPDGRRWEGRWLKSSYCSNGNSNKYFKIGLAINSQMFTRTIHRLVLETYVGPCPEGMEARHLDGDSKNNKVENLIWGTPKENQQDRFSHGTDSQGEKCSTSKLTEQDVRMIIYMYRTGLFLQREIAKLYNIAQVTTSRIVNRKTWKHLYAEI